MRFLKIEINQVNFFKMLKRIELIKISKINLFYSNFEMHQMHPIEILKYKTHFFYVKGEFPYVWCSGH